MVGFNFKPILISLSPNIQRDDIWLALKLLFQPWKWKEGSAAEELGEKFENYLDLDYSFTFNSGRSALLAILKGLGLESGEEVLVQGFTCNAAVNPILEVGLNPIFVDIDPETLNLDPENLKKKIGQKSRVVVVQHTFGLPAPLEEIQEICDRHDLILIEDCAHSLGATYRDRKAGTFGKAAFFSLGRDKVISSVYGGVAVTDDPVLEERMKSFYRQVEQPGYYWIFQQLLHPLLTTLVKIPYGFWKSGRYLLAGFQKLRLLSKSVSQQEKEGGLPDSFPARLPNALARLGLKQFNKLEHFNSHRQAITDFYGKQLEELEVQLPASTSGRIYMRYSLLIEKDTDEVLEKAERENIFLNDGWRKSPVVPPDTELESVKYAWGVAPRAERVAEQIVNLPTHPNLDLDKAQTIVNFLQQEL